MEVLKMAEVKYPVLEKNDDKRVVKVPLREYTFENSCFPTSVKSMGQEILNSPIRIVCRANESNTFF